MAVVKNIKENRNVIQIYTCRSNHWYTKTSIKIVHFIMKNIFLKHFLVRKEWKTILIASSIILDRLFICDCDYDYLFNCLRTFFTEYWLINI